MAPVKRHDTWKLSTFMPPFPYITHGILKAMRQPSMPTYINFIAIGHKTERNGYVQETEQVRVITNIFI